MSDELNASQMEFLYKFIEFATIKNAELLASFCKIYNPCGTFPITEMQPIKCKLLATLVGEDIHKKQRLIKHIKFLHDCYYAFDPTSNTLAGKFNAINDLTKTYGELTRGEFNKLLSELLNSVKENKFYYSKTHKGISVVHLNENYIPIKYLTLPITIRKYKHHDIIYINKQKLNFRRSKAYRTFYNNGLKNILNLHEQVVEIIKKSSTDEACCYCNRIRDTKHRCSNCSKLYAQYLQLLKYMPNLPKNLAQIIKRVPTNKYKNKLELSNAINNKITAVIERAKQEQDKDLTKKELINLNVNRSNAIINVKSALNISFPAK